MPDPRITAIIIVYNGEAFLREAIGSIIAQSFTDWELLVVDDGSVDGSAAIAEEFAALRPGQIKLLRHPDGANHGMSATRNLGLAQARGDYVGFLDADDIWLPDKLKEQVAIMDADPSLAMVYGRTTIWYSWDPNCPNDINDFHYDLGVAPDRQYAPPRLFRNLLKNVYQTPTTCNALMRRHVIAAVGGFEPAFKGMFEDQIFFGKVLLHGPVHVSDQSWAKYRQHAESTSALSAAAGTDEAARVRFLGWMMRYLRGRKGVGGRIRLILWRTLMKARWAMVKAYASRFLPRPASVA